MLIRKAVAERSGEVDTVMGGKIGNDLGREEFGVFVEVVATAKELVLGVGLQPTTESVGMYTRRIG